MISKCANPGCFATFEHRQGRLHRFPKRYQEDNRRIDTQSAQHFWLCATCCEVYSLNYDDRVGVTIGRQFASGPRQIIAAA